VRRMLGETGVDRHRPRRGGTWLGLAGGELVDVVRVPTVGESVLWRSVGSAITGTGAARLPDPKCRNVSAARSSGNALRVAVVAAPALCNRAHPVYALASSSDSMGERDVRDRACNAFRRPHHRCRGNALRGALAKVSIVASSGAK